ncbi:M23 family metallopeptidase [Bacillus massiliglaciei]|uniref:M23 family metallopeptidase n=1 Tax=Bacillus massiliglaciei TaxID=1816693 RepID=UPI000DA5FC5B|nr:M23 family metallopeptidase [Bacillus massiliglaciei]
MDERRKAIQDRIAKRRKTSSFQTENAARDVLDQHVNMEYGMNDFPDYEGSSAGPSHPLFKKEHFFFKVLAALCLFMVIAVIFKHPSAKLEAARGFVQGTMDRDFQFASISNWYEGAFGKPIAFLPEQKKTEELEEDSYALPAAAKITQSFETNGEGIILQTSTGEKVEALQEGVVIFAGEKEDLGKTVIIQHDNKSESWYGHLESIDVSLYEFVKRGSELGEVTASDDHATGKFYLAIRENGAFIDPKKVISFE